MAVWRGWQADHKASRQRSASRRPPPAHCPKHRCASRPRVASQKRCGRRRRFRCGVFWRPRASAAAASAAAATLGHCSHGHSGVCAMRKHVQRGRGGRVRATGQAPGRPSAPVPLPRTAAREAPVVSAVHVLQQRRRPRRAVPWRLPPRPAPHRLPLRRLCALCRAGCVVCCFPPHCQLMCPAPHHAW